MTKENKPEIRFSGFSDAWKQRELNEIADTIDTGKSIFSKSNIGKFKILGSTGVIGFDEDYDYEGSFLLTARVGANAGNLYRSSGKVKITDNTVFIKSKFIDYLFYSLEKFNLKRLSFGTGQPLIKSSELKKLNISVPCDENEITKIEHFFITIDRTITLQLRKLELLKNQKKAFLEKMFPKEGENVPEIRFSGFSDAWKQRKVDDIANRFDNLRVPVAENERHHGNIPYYGANGIQDYVEGFTHDGEFILVAEDGANDLVNYPVQYVNGKIWVNNHAHVLQGKEHIDTKFLKYAFQTTNIGPYLVGGGRSKLNADVMMQILLNIPEEKEQIRVSNFIFEIENNITLQLRKLEILKNIKKSFLQKMFV